MNVEDQVSSATLTSKLSILLILITVDLAITSAVLFCDTYSGIASSNNPNNVKGQNAFLFLIIGSAV
jgi:hypothetical protein